MQPEQADPKGLIRESYNMEEIGMAECRSIFVDWALSLPEAVDQREALRVMLATHGIEGHPMTEVLAEGLAAQPAPQRRGGRAARVSDKT